MYSSRSWDDIIYRDDLDRLNGERAAGGAHPDGKAAAWVDRIHAARRCADAGGGRPDPAERPHLYVCGPTPFVETAGEALVELGHSPQMIKTERFGSMGS